MGREAGRRSPILPAGGRIFASNDIPVWPRASLEHSLIYQTTETTETTDCGVAGLGLTYLSISRRSLHSQHPQGRHSAARAGGDPGGHSVLLVRAAQQTEHQVAGGKIALRETPDLRQVLPENPGQLPGFGWYQENTV